MFSLFLENYILVVWCNSGEARFKTRGNAICIEWLGVSIYGDRH